MKPQRKIIVHPDIEFAQHLIEEAEQLEADRQYQRLVLGDDYCDANSDLEAR